MPNRVVPKQNEEFNKIVLLPEIVFITLVDSFKLKMINVKELFGEYFD